MARERIVSRTITVLCATALCVDVPTATTKVMELELTGIELTESQVLKALQKEYDTDTFKIVSLMSSSKREELYGMKEIDFLKYAQKLDPQTRKAIIEDEETMPENDDVEEPKKSKKGGRK